MDYIDGQRDTKNSKGIDRKGFIRYICGGIYKTK
jgi:hypothetical protein